MSWSTREENLWATLRMALKTSAKDPDLYIDIYRNPAILGFHIYAEDRYAAAKGNVTDKIMIAQDPYAVVVDFGHRMGDAIYALFEESFGIGCDPIDNPHSPVL